MKSNSLNKLCYSQKNVIQLGIPGKEFLENPGLIMAENL